MWLRILKNNWRESESEWKDSNVNYKELTRPLVNGESESDKYEVCSWESHQASRGWKFLKLTRPRVDGESESDKYEVCSWESHQTLRGWWKWKWEWKWSFLSLPGLLWMRLQVVWSSPPVETCMLAIWFWLNIENTNMNTNYNNLHSDNIMEVEHCVDIVLTLSSWLNIQPRWISISRGWLYILVSEWASQL